MDPIVKMSKTHGMPATRLIKVLEQYGIRMRKKPVVMQLLKLTAVVMGAKKITMMKAASPESGSGSAAGSSG